jgi:hypothetical protein
MLHTYDPKMVAVVFRGIPITGFADGTFVTVEHNNDMFTLQVGADGHATRTKSNDNSGKITVTLTQSSPSNDPLTAIHNADRLAPKGVGIGPIQVKDLSGSSLHSAPTAWIMKPPSSAYAKDPQTREWVFETNELSNNPGSNLVP